METDHQFYELFRAKPEWFEVFTKIELPKGCVGKSINHKKIETRSDLVFAPAKKSDPHHVVEFQLYFDHSSFVRTGMSCQALWKELNSPENCRKKPYRPRDVRGIIIFGRKSHIPPEIKTCHPEIQVLVLDDLLSTLKKSDPESFLLDVLAPIVEPRKLLEKDAQKHYRDITENENLNRDERELAGEIYFSLLLQRFKNKSLAQLRKMIAELTPLRETRAAKELIEEGIERGMEKGIEQGHDERNRELVLNMHDAGLSAKRISEVTKITEKAVRSYLKGS